MYKSLYISDNFFNDFPEEPVETPNFEDEKYAKIIPKRCNK
jgi:hypothetical protein